MIITLLQAAKLLNSGQVVAIPTETVYGLAASLDHPEAIARIFTLKGRKQNNPLIIHVSSVEEIIHLTKFLPKSFELLLNALWPGPLTLVMPIIEEKIPSIVRANLSTAGFRIPNHPLTRELLKLTGPLVMPSANLSGKPSATSPKHVSLDFGKDLPVLDGGICSIGLESTILYWTNEKWSLIRSGAYSQEDFLSVLGYLPQMETEINKETKQPLCPGQLYRHYAPKAKLILNKKIPNEGVEAIVGFTNRIYRKNCRLFYLGTSYQADEVAKNLYSILRSLDDQGIVEAFVDMDFPDTGLWVTIRERLHKASSK